MLGVGIDIDTTWSFFRLRQGIVEFAHINPRWSISISSFSLLWINLYFQLDPSIFKKIIQPSLLPTSVFVVTTYPHLRIGDLERTLKCSKDESKPRRTARSRATAVSPWRTSARSSGAKPNGGNGFNKAAWARWKWWNFETWLKIGCVPVYWYTDTFVYLCTIIYIYMYIIIYWG